ncbi:MAG: hypothetical protein ACLROW_11465 [Roseburia faecis]
MEVLTVVLIPPLVQPTPPLSGLIRYDLYQADDASYTQIGFVTDWNKKNGQTALTDFPHFRIPLIRITTVSYIS